MVSDILLDPNLHTHCRFPHTTICLTNSEVDRRNEELINRLPGRRYEFQCVDTVESTPSSFNFAAVARLGYKPRVILKTGCRVMATANSHRRSQSVRFSNGAMGTVQRIYIDQFDEPTVVVKFDHYERAMHVKRETMIVRGPSNEIIFERRQIPLTPCYAITAHRVVGTTLAGVWANFDLGPKRRTSERALDDVSPFWNAQWLRGIAYTVLSRVPGAHCIKVFPLKNTLNNADIFPIFTMDPAALQFDGECARISWLNSEPLPRSPRTPEQHAPVPAGDPIFNDAITSLQQTINGFGNELRKFRFISLVSQHYTTRNSSITGDPVNPVFYCAARATLSNKVENMSIEAQLGFYEMLNEKLNLTFPKPSSEQLDQIAGDLADRAISEGFVSDAANLRHILGMVDLLMSRTNSGSDC